MKFNSLNVNNLERVPNSNFRKFKKICIQCLSGKILKNNSTKIIINEVGIENFTPLRKKYDGITKFGVSENDNDYIILLPNNNSDINTLFYISFNKINNKYYLCKGIYDGNEMEMNIFIKLNRSLCIDKKYYFSFGDVNFCIEPIKNNKIEIWINLENEEKNMFQFSPADKSVTIGRSKKCNIVSACNSLSRVQCSIFYEDLDNFWYLQDGSKDHCSMNGTWLFLNDQWEISEDTEIRIGENSLAINFMNE